MTELEAKLKNTKAGPFNDMAIIKYEMDDEHSEHLSPICLPSQRTYDKWDFTQCKIMGHGFTSSRDEDQFRMPERLQEADIYIANNEECKEGIESSAIKSKITDKTVCIKGPIQPCVGDSGGPILCRGSREYDDDIQSMNWVLVGVTSFAVSTDYSDKCGFFKSAIFAQVNDYRPWIDEIIAKNH
jgi:secreted trypsin-like serine protease